MSNRRPRATIRRLSAVATALGVFATVSTGSSIAAGRTTPIPPRADHGFTETNLVSDLPGRAQVTDPNLVNPWGLSIRKGVLWVSDNGSNKATNYTGATPGKPVRVLSRVVSIPPAGAPTGNVRNDTNAFRFSGFGKASTAQIIFSGEEGDLFAWSPKVSQTNAVRVAHTETGGLTSVYKGLTVIPSIHTRAGGQSHGTSEPELLAANFRFARIDVFDGKFRLKPSNGRFTDPNIPAGFAPFNVKRFGNSVVVTYAKQLPPDNHDDQAGPGNGFVDVFSLDGRLVKRLASRGVLNSPWGLELAPARFGKFSGDLLVGSFGDGTIHAFNLRTGRFEGTVSDRNGNAIVIPGVWGLQRGTRQVGGADALWFAAGIEDEQHGLLGVLRANQ
ncbi:TIGR03118 family protein [Streptomyces sp. NPDC001020]